MEIKMKGKKRKILTVSSLERNLRADGDSCELLLLLLLELVVDVVVVLDLA